MGMENVLRDIEANYANFGHGRLPQVMFNDSPWHIDAVGGRPPHQEQISRLGIPRDSNEAP